MNIFEKRKKTIMKLEYVSYTCNDRIGIIQLCRPEKRNALNSEFINQLSKVFTNASNDKNCKIIILKSEGSVFCAGADLKYLQQIQKNSFEENNTDSRQLMSLFYQIYKCSKLTIAQIQGHAIAGGCGLASVCDLSFSSPSSKFGYTEVKIGFAPAIVSVFLLQKIGETKAKELLLTGKLITADEAEKIGLINKVVAHDELESFTLKYAQDLCNNISEQSVKITKELISEIQNLSMKDGLEKAVLMNASSREHKDFQKGISSFLKNEKIIW